MIKSRPCDVAVTIPNLIKMVRLGWFSPIISKWQILVQCRLLENFMSCSPYDGSWITLTQDSTGLDQNGFLLAYPYQARFGASCSSQEWGHGVLGGSLQFSLLKGGIIDQRPLCFHRLYCSLFRGLRSPTTDNGPLWLLAESSASLSKVALCNLDPML